MSFLYFFRTHKQAWYSSEIKNQDLRPGFLLDVEHIGVPSTDAQDKLLLGYFCKQKSKVFTLLSPVEHIGVVSPVLTVPLLQIENQTLFQCHFFISSEHTSKLGILQK